MHGPQLPNVSGNQKSAAVDVQGRQAVLRFECMHAPLENGCGMRCTGNRQLAVHKNVREARTLPPDRISEYR